MKKKDHLYRVTELTKSVLLGKAAKALCGYEKTFTRQDFDDLEYYPGCKTCMAGAAAETSDVVSIRKKRAWAEIVETAFLDLLEDRSRPWRWTFQVSGSTNASVRPNRDMKLPPAA